ncbi:MAG TPA: DUF3810 domain-containing protein [Blastocatellia bacterium]|nr:DUF3810 domain-containing protein [Blastocatellia bacterium]
MAWKFPFRPPVVIVQASAPAAATEEVAEAVAEEVAEAQKAAVAPAAAAFALRWLFMRGLLALMIAQATQTMAGLMPPMTELMYSQGLYYYILRGLSFLNRFFRFSLGEMFLVMLAMWFLGWTIWYVRRAMRNEVQLFSVVKLLLLHLFWTFVVLFIIFLVLWGYNYQRPAIAETLGLERRPARSDELQVMALQIVKGINDNYSKGREGQDLNGVTRLPYGRETLNQRVEDAFRRVRFLGDLGPTGLGRAKPLYFSHLASMMGFGGVYMPFTGEATFNTEVPPCEQPFMIANQKAHQLGYAREDEANFIAYVVCINADDPFVRYSGFLHGVKVLGYLERGAVGRYREKIDPGPSADLEASGRFWESSRSQPVHGMAVWSLGMFLRLNGVRRGMANYDQDLPLIIGYYLKYPEGPGQVEDHHEDQEHQEGQEGQPR